MVRQIFYLWILETELDCLLFVVILLSLSFNSFLRILHHYHNHLSVLFLRHYHLPRFSALFFFSFFLIKVATCTITSELLIHIFLNHIFFTVSNGCMIFKSDLCHFTLVILPRPTCEYHFFCMIEWISRWNKFRAA